MTRVERIRELVTEPLTSTMLQQRTDAGWQLIALEWRREVLTAAPGPDAGNLLEELPYGLRVATDCHHLEADPGEQGVLLSMMELMVQDLPLSEVAGRLNEKGFRRRSGALWSMASVFDMLPRLIEVGPKLFSGSEWEARRRRFLKAI